jgi:hypothetical protein
MVVFHAPNDKKKTKMPKSEIAENSSPPHTYLPLRVNLLIKIIF